MVNPGLVNARTSCPEHADFCEIFLVSGRFLHFKNPFKYAGSFNLNHETVHFAAWNALVLAFFIYVHINTLRKH